MNRKLVCHIYRVLKIYPVITNPLIITCTMCSKIQVIQKHGVNIGNGNIGLHTLHALKNCVKL